MLEQSKNLYNQTAWSEALRSIWPLASPWNNISLSGPCFVYF